MSPDELPDLPHLLHVRDRLWEGQETGRATVLVGSGFSRNAEPSKPDADQYPLWTDVARAIYNELHSVGPNPSEEERRKREVAIRGDVLTLAYEYEISFGREALDELLFDLIPDDQYQPGTIHRLLLSLPWSDVFTTNYDTLLERTLEQPILDRSYDLVTTPADLPGSLSPRIIKLHGSFPSLRPFILTEEDYRKYPNESAPLVNSVQQALMENAFLLLGFSGSDPNFLQWIGWIRDHLGDSAPPFYLCGLLDLSSSRRKLLDARGVTPIDLGPLFPSAPAQDYVNEAERHRTATEWLLRTLHQGRPPRATRWPNPAPSSPPPYLNVSSWNPQGDLPDPVEGPPNFEEIPRPNQSVGESDSPEREEDLVDILLRWKHNREAYPGWVVLPERNRKLLWRKIEPWGSKIFGLIEDLEVKFALVLLYELVWRFEKTGRPLSVEERRQIENVLEDVDPFDEDEDANASFEIPPSNAAQEHVWEVGPNHLRQAWIELAFSVARTARQDGMEDLFDTWTGKIKSVASSQPEYRARYHYEKALFYLGRLEYDAVRDQLKRWPNTQSSPFWGVRRAGVMAEIGELDDAFEQVEDSLRRIRAGRDRNRHNLRNYSEEGWATKLLTLIDSGRAGFDIEHRERAKERRAAYNDRWDRLSSFRCNPTVHLRAAAQEIGEIKPSLGGRKEVVDEFTGKKTVKYKFSGSVLSKLLPSFSFIYLLEETGIPLRVGNMTVNSEDVVRSAEWAVHASSGLALSVMMRMASKKKSLELFDRVRIASFSEEQSLRLIERIESAIEYVLQEWDSANSELQMGWNNELEFELNLLKRLSIRTPKEIIPDSFQTAIHLFKEMGKRRPLNLVDPVVGLLKNLFEVSAPEHVSEILVDLAGLPLPSDFGLSSDIGAHKWEEPLYLAVREVGPDRLSPHLSPPSEGLQGAVQKLATEARFGRQHDRRAAIHRLTALHRIGALDEESTDVFIEAVWSKVDDETGLPENTGLNYRGLLRLPGSEEKGMRERIRRHLKNQDFPRATDQGEINEGDQVGGSFPSSVGHYIKRWIVATRAPNSQDEETTAGIEWSSEEVSDLLEGACEWWEDERSGLSFSDQRILGGDHFRRLFGNLEVLLSSVILPYLARENNESIERAARLIDEMRSEGLPTLVAETELTRLSDSRIKPLQRRIRRSLVSSDDAQAQSAARAAAHWTVHSHEGRLPEPDKNLPSLLTERLLTERIIRMRPVLNSIKEIVEMAPQKFTEGSFTDLAEGLDRLIGETEFPTEVERLRSDISEDLLRNLHRIRADSVSLANSIRRRMDDDQIPESEELSRAVSKWEEIAKETTLPEIRSAWGA